MKLSGLFLLFLGVVFLVMSTGCMGLFEPRPVVVSSKATESVSLSKGKYYIVEAVVRNDGADGGITVVAELINANTGHVRDRESQNIYLRKGETQRIRLELDGEFLQQYQFRVYAR